MSLRSFVATAVVGSCLAVPVALVGISAVALQRQSISAQIDRGQQLAATAATLQAVALGSGSSADQAVLRQFVRAVVVGDVAFVVVADAQNNVVAAASAPGQGEAATFLVTVPADVVVVDAAVIERDRQSKAELPAGRVVVGLTRLSPTRTVAAVAVAAAVVALVCVLLLLWLLEWRLVRPVRAVAQGLGRVVAGDLAVDVQAPIRDDDEVSLLVEGFHALVEAQRAKGKLQSSLSSAAGSQVVADLDALDAPPKEADVSVLFVDVRDFTPLTAALSPADTVAFLDRLLCAFVDVVHRHGGHVERFLGDGLVAVWGAPQPCADHAVRAVAAAVDLEARAKILSRRAKEDGQQAFVVGVGVHSGMAVTGGVGPPSRRAFAVTGEVPALARRVQQEAKGQGLLVLVTEETFKRSKDAVVDVSWDKTPPMLVRGIGMPVTLYRPKRMESVTETDRIKR
ncbi:MAG: adenylate/guanylate cyclase domain-containing protein [Deltaproteobacteria bacterium]|nr:adenylate/guanylate cyclase domain-containing protein [Deltaproteobacteria bacterium]